MLCLVTPQAFRTVQRTPSGLLYPRSISTHRHHTLAVGMSAQGRRHARTRPPPPLGRSHQTDGWQSRSSSLARQDVEGPRDRPRPKTRGNLSLWSAALVDASDPRTMHHLARPLASPQKRSAAPTSCRPSKLQSGRFGQTTTRFPGKVK